MAARRRRSENIIQKLTLRQIRGGNPWNSLFRRSSLLTKYLPRLCIPLCDIQESNAFHLGHVLLGFTKSGEYLMSYCQKVEYENVFGFPNYTYTLHWWRFNLMKPLHEVCHISLFVGEFITEELHLVVCHTLDDNRILIHGYCRPGHDEQSRQCYMTLCPSPPCIKCSSISKDGRVNQASVCNNSYIVHLKYTLLPPFPMFIPSTQLKLKDIVLLNTVDSLLAITVTHHTNHKLGDSAYGFQPYDQVVNQHSSPLRTDRGNGVPYPEENDLINECTDLPTVGKEGKQRLCNADSKSIKVVNNYSSKVIDRRVNELLIHGKETAISHSMLRHLSSFGVKTFCFNCPDLERAENPPGVIDGTSLDIQVTNLHNVPFKLTQILPHNNMVKTNQSPTPVHESPCIHTQVVSLDVERYISEALNTSDLLKGMYSFLRNYSTQIVDVCHRSQRVILQVVSLISIQPKAENITRRIRCSISFLLSWCVSNGEVCTLDVSPLMDQKEKSDKQMFKEGNKRILDLRKKVFVPSGLTGMQAFSNHTVFTGTSLEFIKHPFQPLAVIL